MESAVNDCFLHLLTDLLSAKSVLLPTNMMITSLPLSALTSSIHLFVCWNELPSAKRGTPVDNSYLIAKAS